MKKVTCASNEWLEGDLFDDVQDAKTAEQNDPAFLREQNANLSKELDKAVNALHMLRDGAVSTVAKLKAELFKVEDERRKEIRQLQTENASMRKALAFTISQLKSYQCKTAAITRWKNFFRDELTAQEYINAYQEQDIEKLKNKLVDSIQPGMLSLLNAVRNAPVINRVEDEPLMLVAETE